MPHSWSSLVTHCYEDSKTLLLSASKQCTGLRLESERTSISALKSCLYSAKDAVYVYQVSHYSITLHILAIGI